MIERLTFFALVVQDMKKAIEFYTETLGLTINEQESVTDYYTQFDVESVAGFALISGLDDSAEPYDIALKVDDADAVYARLQAAGVELINAPRDIPWGRTFLLRTPDDHVLRIYSPRNADVDSETT